MISLSMMRPGPDPGGYYLARQAGCPADYYLGAEPAGRWMGSGAAKLGLTGRLDSAGAGVFRGLLAGQAPDGRSLVAPVLRADARGRLPAAPLVEAIRARAAKLAGPIETLLQDRRDRSAFSVLERRVDGPQRHRTATVKPTDAGRLAHAAGLDVVDLYRSDDGTDRYAAALRLAGKCLDVRRPGIDVTVSAPKSVSILYGLGDADVAAVVRAAHEFAVGEALAYLETVAGHALRGHQGDGQRAQRTATDGWIVAAFEHRTSRAGDPQLHTHLVVPNLLRGMDGKWSAIDSRAVHRHALTASYLYHAILRGQLTRQLGVAWTAPVKGIAELAGVPRELISAFSTRRRQILAHLANAGRSGPDAAQAACLATRPEKPHAEPEPTLRERWRAKAKETGCDPRRLMAAVLGRARPPSAPSIDRLANHLLGPTGVTAHATGFDRRDLLQALCQSLPPGLPVDLAQLEAAGAQILGHRSAVRLATRPDDGPRWSTTELLGIEHAALLMADGLRTSASSVAAPELVEAALEGRGLSAEQAAMVRNLAEASGLAVVVGPAGAGKTASLAAAVGLWEAQGRPITGGAVAAVTARRLEHATGIPSTSLARLLTTARSRDPATGRQVGLPQGGVLVVDEASMVDTRILAALLAHTRAAGATLVLVGDPAQLPEIGAGGLFTALARHPDTITLSDNRRQTEGWERAALADLRAGDPDSAVAAYAAHGRIHTAPSERLADRIVDDYLRHLEQPGGVGQKGRHHVVMLAVRRVDVTELNDTTRQRLLDNGLLGQDAVTVGEGDRVREYRRGDKVVVTANDHRLGLLNGSQATVTHVDQRRRTLSLVSEEDDTITVPAAWAERHLDHGYAMTCHKAQGATVDTGLLYGSSALTREAGYVALSRGRTANYLYVADDHDDARPHGEEHLDRLAARLAVRTTQTLATHQLPRTTPNRWERATTQHHPVHRSEGIAR